MTAREGEVEAEVGESSPTMPEIFIEVVEGLTDRAAIPPPRRDETQIAQAPGRPISPSTEIVHPVAPGLAMEVPLDLPLTQNTGGTAHNPELRRRRRLYYGLITATLLLIIGTSVYEIQRLGVDVPEPTANPKIEKIVQEPPELPPAPLPVMVQPSLEELDRGYTTKALLALDIEEVLADGRRRSLGIADGPIAAGAVTVVNLWATWCKPCKDELPGFQALFRRSGWGSEIRFTPILIDSKDPVWARTKFAGMMPAGVRFFVDPLQGAVTEALRGPGLLPKDSGLPVTAVFDCRRRARVVYTQGLTDADFLKLAEIVQTLRGELGQAYCNPKPRRVTTTPPPPPMVRKIAPIRCGNGDCETGETPEDCCDCLDCHPHKQRCESPNGSPICVDTVSGLKD